MRRGPLDVGSHDGAPRSYPATKSDRSNGSLLTTLGIRLRLNVPVPLQSGQSRRRSCRGRARRARPVGGYRASPSNGTHPDPGRRVEVRQSRLAAATLGIWRAGDRAARFGAFYPRSRDPARCRSALGARAGDPRHALRSVAAGPADRALARGDSRRQLVRRCPGGARRGVSALLREHGARGRGRRRAACRPRAAFRVHGTRAGAAGAGALGADLSDHRGGDGGGRHRGDADRGLAAIHFAVRGCRRRPAAADPGGDRGGRCGAGLLVADRGGVGAAGLGGPRATRDDGGARAGIRWRSGRRCSAT